MLLSKLLVIVDDFDRAIANMPAELRDLGWVEGIVAIDRKLDLLLDSEGLSPIEAVGKQFDPHEHEAVVQEERDDVADGTVVAELQRGYRIGDRVLRPSDGRRRPQQQQPHRTRTRTPIPEESTSGTHHRY